MIDFLMSGGTIGWIVAGFIFWLMIKVIVCSEDFNGYMFTFDMAFLCFVFVIIYFNDDVRFFLW